jgi:hypothetical protein
MMIEHDIDCMQCGYNLRGLAGDGLCPECARSVAESIKWAADRRPERAWIKCVRAALLLVVASGALGMVAIPNSRGMDAPLRPWQQMLTLAAGLASVAAVWLVARREKHRDWPAWQLGALPIAAAVTMLPPIAITIIRFSGAIRANWVLVAHVSAGLVAAMTLAFYLRLRTVARRVKWSGMGTAMLVTGIGLCAANALGLIIFHFRGPFVFAPIAGAGMPGMILPVISVIGERNVTNAWQFYAWLVQPIFLIVSWATLMKMYLELGRWLEEQPMAVRGGDDYDAGDEK